MVKQTKSTGLNIKDMGFEGLMIPHLPDQIVFWDAETIKSEREGVRDYLYEKAKPPGTLKDPAKKAAWYGSDKHDDAADTAFENTVFDGLFGEVVTLAWARFNKDTGDLVMNSAQRTDTVTEAEVVKAFFDDLESHPSRATRHCGFNILGFDIPFVRLRGAILGVPVPKRPFWPTDIKPWSKEVCDLMKVISEDRQKSPSMDKALFALGLDGKGDIDGSMVGDLWEIGDYDLIDEYCQDDVVKTARLWLRLAQCGLC